jgi:arylsulfatase
LTEKWYPFEESIRVPLVIQDPRMPKDKRGTTNGDWTLNIDLAPSLLGAANVPQSSFMQGKDMAHLYLPNEMMMDPAIAAEPWRKDWFYEYHMGNDPITAMDHTGKNWIDASFALVTNEWKYVLWPQHNYEQLFHRSLDPYDERDLLDQRKNYTQLQTTLEVYETMKARFAALKERAQSGHRV